MYSVAYAAGFRTAFVSLNSDNTPNSASWAQNGLALKALIPEIATYLNVRHVYIIGYSKGGLDAQAALLSPDYTSLDNTISPLVKAVFTLGTPNQGTALADWAFGPGQSLAQQFGLLSPGLQSLEVATVQNFRSKADPVFAASQLQFYSFAGDSASGSQLWQYTTSILAGLTPGPNDGFVAVSSTVLPYSYSMDIGEIAANQSQMNQGNISFPVVNGSVQGLEREIHGFRKIMTGGFGDNSNTWAWSMKWFNHKLYVGTGREVNCVSYAIADAQHGTHLYPPKGGNCPADPKDLRLAAEIWQYTPETNTWLRVFQSPENIPIGNDASGQPVNTARDIGFRSMIVFTETDGTQALYLGGVTSGELFASNAAYPPRILRTTDGVTFTPIPQDPGTFLGDLAVNTAPQYPVCAIRSLAEFNGMMLATAADYLGIGSVIASSTPSVGDGAWYQASAPASQFPVWTLDVFAGHLWAIGGERSDHDGYFAAYTDAQGTPPYAFINVIAQGGNPSNGAVTQDALSTVVFQGHLYVGSNWPSELVRINSDLSWDLVVGDPRVSPQGQKNPLSGIGESFDNQFNAQFMGMTVVPSGRHQGLTLGTWDLSSEAQAIPQLGNLAEPNFGADVMMSPDGIQWSSITATGFGDGLNYGVRAIESTPFGTFIGTTRAVGGTQIWLDQTNLDFSADGIVDQPDVAVVQAGVGQAATQPYDPRDLDQDGQITANDVQLITSQCALPNCAAPPNPASQPAAPANLAAAPKSASGSTVSLTWSPVSGAVDYRVYRQTQTPLLDFFPAQGIPIAVFGFSLTIPQDLEDGKLNSLCSVGGSSIKLCSAVTFLDQAVLPNSTIGFPTVVAYLGKTPTTTYQETAPSQLQSLYFVRAEDSNGNLSAPSNVAGGPSDARGASSGPSLTVSSGPLSFSTQAGSATPISAQSIPVASSGAPLGFTASASVTTPAGGRWLTVSPGSGTAPASPSTIGLTVTANAAGLNAGSYSGAIAITDPSGNIQQVSVTLTVTAVTTGSSLVITPKSLTFSYQRGGSAPASQTLTVGSSGAALAFTASASVSTPAHGSWLQVSPAQGKAPSWPAGATLTAAVSTAGLSAGAYTGTITLIDHHGTSYPVGVTLTVGQGAKPPAAPPATPDPTQPNLFYGAIPPNGPNGPVLVFVHGLGGTASDWWDQTGNDMYDLAYQAGFRTSFMSLSLDNTPNNADIPTNAAMLQTMFPKILSHFGVSKVYFICHSKGGLDLQDAIANTQWIGISKAVFTLGTPNQGDALADWVYSPAGNQIGQTLGLLTPGVQALETANVLQFRAQWDPIFQTAKIPFYTVWGNTYACASGTATCPTAITGPILTSITGATKAPLNDGLVTQPETVLPTSYAMALGVINANHYLLRMGNNSFPYIFARVMAQENQQPGFSMTSTNGFGDIHNTWSWSMQWFKGQLYVGTGREVACVTQATAMLQSGLPLYPPPNTNCPADYHNLPLQAEIWQFTPQTQAWVRVFQSPNSLQTTDNQGNTVMTARDIGFRGMTVVNEPDGTQALYAGGVTSGAIFAPQSNHTAWAPPRILRSVDGVNWAPLPQDPGTFLGNLSASGTQQYPIYSVRAASQYNGVLFLQVGDFQGTGRVISSLPGANPATGDDAFQFASPPTSQLPIWILEQYNNFLYAGTGFPNGSSQYGVYKTDASGAAPYTWSPVVIDGAYAQGLIANYAMSMQVFSDPTGCPGVGCLYVGTDRPTELIRIHPDDSWEVVIGNPRTVPAGQPGAGQVKQPISGIGQYFANGFTGHFWRMGVGGKGLYLSTWDDSDSDNTTPSLSSYWNQEFGTDVFRTSDGIHWQIVSKIAFGDGANTGGRSYAATPFGLFWGTARDLGGTQVFNLDNSILDYNNDGEIDQLDVNLMTARLNTPANGSNDPMDLNQDGQITILDVQLLQTQCTNAGCAVAAALPSYDTLPSPTVSSAPGSLGGSVSLTWNAVAGAHDYLIYRIITSPNVNAPVPSLPSGVSASQLSSACNSNADVGETDLCNETATTSASNVAYGYPGPVTLLTRVSGASYTETSPTSLQSLYFVRTEDANGNLSAPSNVVGGPSLAPATVPQSSSLVITPGSLAFSYPAGGPLPGPQSILIGSSAAPLGFTAAASVTTPADGTWLGVSPASATAPSSPATTSLSVTVNSSGLAPGAYTGSVTITDASQNVQQVGVTLTVPSNSATSTSLNVTPSSLAFAYQIGAAGPPAASAITIQSTGQPVAFSALSSVTTPAGGTWLNLSASAGTAPAAPANTALSATVDPTGLMPGTYAGTIFITTASGGSRQVSVTFTVAPPVPSSLVLSSQVLSFSYNLGGALPQSQTVMINTTAATLPFSASASSVGGWLSVAQTSQAGLASPGLAFLSVNVAGLAAGSYTGAVTITAPSATNSPQTVTVNLTVGTSTGNAADPTPIPVNTPRVIPHLANGLGWKTTILLVNTDTQPQSFTLSFWDNVGIPLVLPLGADGTASSVTGTIQPGMLRVIHTDGSGDALVEGWVNFVAASTVGGTLIFTAQSDGQPPSEAGVPLNIAGGTQLYVPFDQTSDGLVYATGLALANSSDQAATVSVTFVDEFGQNIPVTGTIAVPAYGHYAAVLGDLFPAIRGKRGVAQIHSNVALYGLGIRFNGAAFTSIDALAKAPAGPKVISHIANGQGWKTTILLVNTDTQPAQFTLSFWNSDGTALNLPLRAVGSVSSVSGTIAPGNIRIIQTDGLGSALVEGWANLATTAAIGGTAIFTASSTGQPPSEAAVSLSSTGNGQLFVPFDNTSGALSFATGFALANPGTQAASVVLSFTDDSGQTLPVTANITVPANGHYAAVSGIAFPALQGKRGAVHFSSGAPLYGIGIRYNGLAFTSLPDIGRGSN